MFNLSLVLFAITLRGLPVSVSYAAWSAGGTAAVSAVGMTLFGERVSAAKVASLAAIMAGVVSSNLAESST
jgi:small multidrug resistance pump